MCFLHKRQAIYIDIILILGYNYNFAIFFIQQKYLICIVSRSQMIFHRTTIMSTLTYFNLPPHIYR